MLPLASRLASMITSVEEGGRTVARIQCGPTQASELLTKGYLRQGAGANSFTFDGYPIRVAPQSETWMEVTDKDGTKERLSV